MRNLIKWLFLLGMAGTGILVLAGFLNELHPAFDTMAQLRLHLSVGLIAGAIIFLASKRKMFAIVSLLIGVFGLSSASSGTVFSASLVDADPNKPVYRLFHMNLFWNNRRKAAVIDLIREKDPHIISISEIAGEWAPFLHSLEKDWPYMAHCPEWSTRGGIKILSKWKLDHSNDYCGDYGSLLLTEVISDSGERFTVGSTHPRWPWPASGPRQMKRMLPRVARIGPDALVAGDFNATTWSHSVNNFAKTGQLTLYDGIGATWFFLPLPASVIRLIGLPIDNVMSKGKITVLSAKSLETLGSDHLPILVNFQLH